MQISYDAIYLVMFVRVSWDVTQDSIAEGKERAII